MYTKNMDNFEKSSEENIKDIKILEPKTDLEILTERIGNLTKEVSDLEEAGVSAEKIKEKTDLLASLRSERASILDKKYLIETDDRFSLEVGKEGNIDKMQKRGGV